MDFLPSGKIQGLMGEGLAPSGLDGPLILERLHYCHCSGQCANIHCTDPMDHTLGGPQITFELKKFQQR